MSGRDVCGAIVAGGGPAGAAAALVLARAGVRVALVDSPRPEPPGTHDYKIGETLPAAATPLLRDLGLWAKFTADGGTHLHSTGVYTAWGGSALQERGSLHDPYGSGWQLNRLRFDAFLREEAYAAGAEPVDGRVVEVADGPDNTRLFVRGHRGVRERHCTWVVDATGRTAVLARHRATRRRQDRLVAAHVLLRRPTAADRSEGTGADREARTLVEAVEEGWWYTTLTPGGRIVAHLTDTDLADPRLRTPDGFLSAATNTRHIQQRLMAQDFTEAPRPAWSPAHGQCLMPCCGHGWIAAGDAALAFDPLSSQGILSALHTGARAGIAVALCLAGAPSESVLGSYTQFLGRVARSYSYQHAEAYALERRWPDHLFWKRRTRSPGAGR
ncbi:FAD-dependent monooxygenase [Streptomyces sp. NPDC048106]|uniref:FAD-dependent monooxygenase n=1 Tax=Streptomyces sp. NPDC048106 TaxID=3155750 RepID=UPI0034531BCD